MDDDWKVKIERPLDCLVVRIWIYRDTMHIGTRTRVFITDLAKREYTQIAPGGMWKDIKPTMELEDRFADAILAPLVKALVKDGFAPEEYEKKDTGDELKATKYHLEDMRELVAHVTELKPKLVFKRQEVKENHEF